MTRRSLRLAFYGDDLTGSTDALDQLTLAGLKTVLFLEPPTHQQLRQFPHLQACGIAGVTRSLAPAALAKTLRPVLQLLRSLGAAHVHYKVCSTFDSSPQTGSIGRVLDVAATLFRSPFIPLLVAAPGLGRYTVFGNHFARFGTGTQGQIHRLDRHPSVSRHPVTPMAEADLRQHLALQTNRRIALFDILQLQLPAPKCRQAFRKTIAARPQVVLFDTLTADDLTRAGELIDGHASVRKPLFSIGSSGIETALCGYWRNTGKLPSQPGPLGHARPVRQLLVGCGSCSPVTARQITWALKNGFGEVALNVKALATSRESATEVKHAIRAASNLLASGRSLIIHTNGHLPANSGRPLKKQSAKVVGSALGRVLFAVLAKSAPGRLCLAGGDTSGFAARALKINALEMIAPLVPGAPLCRAHAANSPADAWEMVFKGGQVGTDKFFGMVKSGTNNA